MAAARKLHAFHRIPPRVLWSLIALAVAAFGLWQTHSMLDLRAQHIADAKAWAIEGPPCPTETEAAFLTPHKKGPKRVDYEDVILFRRFGHVSCAMVHEDGGRSGRAYPECQFTGPGELMVRAHGRQWVFNPGVGQPATITLQGGQAHCLMASNFTVKTAMAGTDPR